MGTDLQSTRNYDIADMIASSQQQAQTAVPSTSPYYVGTPESGIINGMANISPAIMYESFSTGTGNDDQIYGVNWAAQTFTPSVQHTIYLARLFIRKYGSPSTLTVSIRATSGGVPTGADLTVGTINGNNLETYDNGWNIEFNPPLLLTSGTTYAFVVRALSGNGTNYVNWYWSAGGYSGGQKCYSTNSGSSWTAAPTVDYFFGECGLP